MIILKKQLKKLKIQKKQNNVCWAYTEHQKLKNFFIKILSVSAYIKYKH